MVLICTVPEIGAEGETKVARREKHKKEGVEVDTHVGFVFYNS